MAIKRIDLSWIIASDLKKSKDFFTNTLGLKIHSSSDEYNWLEVGGKDGGCALGIGQQSDYQPDDKPGQNAVITFTVDDIVETKKELESKGVKIDDIMVIEGHVKLASFTDFDGNKFQLAECLSK